LETRMKKARESRSKRRFARRHRDLNVGTTSFQQSAINRASERSIKCNDTARYTEYINDDPSSGLTGLSRARGERAPHPRTSPIQGIVRGQRLNARKVAGFDAKSHADPRERVMGASSASACVIALHPALHSFRSFVQRDINLQNSVMRSP
jgi:hypothetical protein